MEFLSSGCCRVGRKPLLVGTEGGYLEDLREIGMSLIKTPKNLDCCIDHFEQENVTK